MSKKYKLAITMTQVTDGEVDNQTIVEEHSEDGAIHVIKCKAFVQAFNDATQSLMDMALVQQGKPEKEEKPKAEELFVR